MWGCLFLEIALAAVWLLFLISCHFLLHTSVESSGPSYTRKAEAFGGLPA